MELDKVCFKFLEMSELLTILLHFWSKADGMPPPDRGSCGDLHSSL